MVILLLKLVAQSLKDWCARFVVHRGVVSVVLTICCQLAVTIVKATHNQKNWLILIGLNNNLALENKLMTCS